MANKNDDDVDRMDDDGAPADDSDVQTPAGMRKQLDKLARENAALSRENAEFKKAAARGDREASLKEKGFRPEAAEFIPEEAWANPRLLDEFLAERAWLAQEARQEALDSREEVESLRRGLTPAQVDAFDRIQRVGAQSGDAPADLNALQQQIRSAKNPEELDALLGQYRLS